MERKLLPTLGLGLLLTAVGCGSGQPAGITAKSQTPTVEPRAESTEQMIIRLLIEELASPRRGGPDSVCSVLGEIGRPAVGPLVRALQDEQYAGHYRAVIALGEMGPEAKAAVPVLIEAMKDGDEGMRASAAAALGEIGAAAKAAVPALIRALRDKDQSTRSNAADALGRIGSSSKEVVDALVAALADDSAEVRCDAIGSLAAMGPSARAAAAALKRSRQDPEPYVRLDALIALAAIRSPLDASVELFVEGLRDKNPHVRREVAAALGELGSAAKPAVPALIALLKDKSLGVRQDATLALHRIRSAEAGKPGRLPHLRQGIPPRQHEPAYIELDSVVANLNEPRLARYVRCEVVLVVSVKHRDQLADVVRAREPELRNWLLTYLSDLTLDHVRGAKGLERVRRAILAGFNARLRRAGCKPKVQDVLLKSLVVQ